MLDTNANAPAEASSASTTTPAAPETSVAPVQEQSAPDQNQAPVDPAQAQAPQFQPDWKFKVKDKEFEIDEWARPLAKDEETYKKLKRVWERHHGLDEVVGSRDQLKKQLEQFEPVKKEYETITKRLNEISHYYNKGDFDSFFEALQIPYDTIFNYVKQKHQMSQLPQEVQHQLEKSRQAEREAYNYKQQLDELSQSQDQLRQQQQSQYIDSVIQSKAGDVAQKYNELMGHPDSFKAFVVLKGQAMFQTLGQHAPVDQVVEAAKNDIAKLFGNVAPANPAPQSAAPVPGEQPKPPVIPAVRAGSQSPVRQPPKSLDDLKKLAQQF